MEKQEVKSKWDELARQIGAEVSPESEQLVEPPASTTADVESQESYEPEPASQVASPRRPAAGWDNLASEFGLPVPEPLVEPIVERAPPFTERIVEARPRVEQVTEDRPGREHARPPRRERSDDRREAREARRDESGRRGEERNREREERPRRGERRPRRGRERSPRVEEAEVQATAETVEQAATETPATPVSPPQVEPSKPAAISLWHKIFGLPAEQPPKQDQGEPIIEPPATPFRVEEERRSPLDDSFESAAIGSTDAGERDDTDLDDESLTSTAADEAPADDRRRPRRRRRSRGGRGRRADGDRDEDRSTDQPRRVRQRADIHDRTDRSDRLPEDFDEDDIDDESEPILHDQDSDLDAEGDSITDLSDERATRAKTALQRSIPSWDEAIGCIIEANMQGRSQRRPSTHSGTRSNSGRGRPRGRRRR